MKKYKTTYQGYRLPKPKIVVKCSECPYCQKASVGGWPGSGLICMIVPAHKMTTLTITDANQIHDDCTLTDANVYDIMRKRSEER